MSEQKTGYMQQLDNWIDQNVVLPLTTLFVEGEVEEDPYSRVEKVKKAIKAKTLESYRNGRDAGAGHVRREFRKETGPAGRKDRVHVQTSVH